MVALLGRYGSLGSGAVPVHVLGRGGRIPPFLPFFRPGTNRPRVLDLTPRAHLTN